MSEHALIPGADDGCAAPRAAPPPGLLRAGDVARAIRVTPQAVGLWAREHGMPVAHTDGLGRRYFDLHAVRRWVSANRPRALARQGGGGHGGQRAGSGRPRRRVAATDEAPLLAAALRHDGGEDVRDVSPLTRERTRVEKLKAERLEVELAARRRELVRRDEVEAAIAAAARTMAGLCAGMSQRLAAEIVARAGLAPGMVPVIEDMVREEADALVDALLADPLGDAGARGEAGRAAA